MSVGAIAGSWAASTYPKPPKITSASAARSLPLNPADAMQSRLFPVCRRPECRRGPQALTEDHIADDLLSQARVTEGQQRLPVQPCCVAVIDDLVPAESSLPSQRHGSVAGCPGSGNRKLQASRLRRGPRTPSATKVWSGPANLPRSRSQAAAREPAAIPAPARPVAMPIPTVPWPDLEDLAHITSRRYGRDARVGGRGCLRGGSGAAGRPVHAGMAGEDVDQVGEGNNPKRLALGWLAVAELLRLRGQCGG
jgi:hypothetical protein